MLAGGASRRMGGRPKGLEDVGGRRIIDRVASVLSDVCGAVLLAANDPSAADWLPGVRVVADRHPGAGGLAGVEAALALGRSALVVAWDMPFVTSPLMRAIVRAAQEHDAEVALPDSDSPYGFEPFCAYYDARLLPTLTAFLTGGGGAARDFLRRVASVHRISLAETGRLGDPERFFFSVNGAADLERARAMAASAE